MPGVELSELLRGAYAVAGYALVADLSSHTVSKLSMVMCTSEFFGEFSRMTQ